MNWQNLLRSDHGPFIVTDFKFMLSSNFNFSDLVLGDYSRQRRHL
jgi:hypothetical protein